MNVCTKCCHWSLWRQTDFRGNTSSLSLPGKMLLPIWPDQVRSIPRKLHSHPRCMSQASWPHRAQVCSKPFLIKCNLTVSGQLTEFSPHHSPSFLLNAWHSLAGRTLFHGFNSAGWRRYHPIINLSCLNTLSEAPPTRTYIIIAGSLTCPILWLNKRKTEKVQLNTWLRKSTPEALLNVCV